MKSKKKIIGLILIILVLLILLIGIVYAKTDLFKSTKDLFYKYIDEIKTAIDNFESDLAIEVLNKIKDVKLDKDNKIIIEETLELINMFKYDEALECISKLNKDILNTNFK